MGKKLIISESEVDEIRRMYGLLVEQQYSDGMIPAKGYEIIEDIEGNMGKARKVNGVWKPTPTPYNGDVLETQIKNYITKYLTEKQWFKIDPLFRTQIYSFMFQAGSSSGREFRWIAGLANAIDPSLDRSEIINDENKRDFAAKIINQAINSGKINNFYNNYLSVVDTQYKGLKKTEGKKEDIEEFGKQYEIVWKNRPRIIEEMWNGATIKDIMNKYFPDPNVTKSSKINPTGIPTKYSVKQVSEPTTNIPSKKKEKITGKDLQEFLDNIRNKTVGLKVDFDSVNIDMDKRELTFSLDETKEPVKRLTFAVNQTDEKTCESCVNIGVKNNVPDDKRIKGKFENGRRMFELFALY
jgi:hypothetical protein